MKLFCFSLNAATVGWDITECRQIIEGGWHQPTARGQGTSGRPTDWCQNGAGNQFNGVSGKQGPRFGVIETFCLTPMTSTYWTSWKVRGKRNIVFYLTNNSLYHILDSDYAEFARRDIGDVTITHISTPCKKCLSISARVQKMHINDVTMKKYVTIDNQVCSQILQNFVFIY
jgi:hypothetical protein